VSAAALFFALTAGGGVSLAGAVPSSSGDGLTSPLQQASGTVTGATQDVGSAVQQVLPAPAPQPSPSPSGPLSQVLGPVTGTVSAVTGTVGSLVSQAPQPTIQPTITPTVAPPGGSSSHQQHPTTSGATGGQVKPVNVPQPTYPLPRSIGDAELGSTFAPGTAEPQAARGVTPQLTPEPHHRASLFGLGSDKLPSAVVLLAFTAIAAVVAGHVGIWQNRRSNTSA
jgi:hypothetical protein